LYSIFINRCSTKKKILCIGELPLLKDGSVWVAGIDRILAHLVHSDKDANKDLTPEQKADFLA
jgi:hypothetical protein